MGFKNVKEFYRIGHQVHVTKEGICIGSPYISDIMVIGFDGVLQKRYANDRSNEDLARYQGEMDADPRELQRLVLAPDRFEASIVVYTYDGGNIVEELCEQPGWPNVTHQGHLMYDNTFSTDKARVVRWAKRNADAGIELYTDRIAELRKTLAEREADLEQCRAERAKLEADYPDVCAANRMLGR